MFRRNKNTTALSSPAVEPELTAPIPAHEETIDLSAERLALTKHLGELVSSSSAAFNKELQLARERGLSLEDQEAYMKTLWAEHKIPRILAKGLRNHTTELKVVRPEKVDEIKIYELDRFDPSRPSVESPQVYRDIHRVRKPDTPEDEPVIRLDDLYGYFEGRVNTAFMPEVSTESFERLQAMAAVLEEAAVVDANPAQ